jgi:DNA-binding transcriptional MerR regulator
VIDQELRDFEEGYYPARFNMYELRAMTGVWPRSVYYYIQRRLIPNAIGFGPAAKYTYEHVIRLNVILILKKRDLTLREIGMFLDGHTLRELHGVAEGRDPDRGIYRVRRFYHRAQGVPPKGLNSLTRMEITKGIELFVSDEFLAKAAVRVDELTKALDEILEFGQVV